MPWGPAKHYSLGESPIEEESRRNQCLRSSRPTAQRANSKANPHLSMKTPTSMCAVSVLCVYFAWWNWENICACVCVCAKKVLAKSTAAFTVTHGSIPSDLSIQKMKNPLFFTLIPLRCYLSLSFNFLLLFFYSIISSSHAVWMFSPDSHGRTEPGAPALLLECH